jgi:hypothetical protein
MAVQAALLAQAKSMALQVGTKFLDTLKDSLNPKKIAEAMQSMADTFGKMTESITGAVSSVDKLIGKFVALSNPGVYDRFTRAFADMQAVFGRILAPVLTEATALVRKFGDAIANASPEFVQSIQSMGRLVVSVAGSIAKFAAMTGYIWSKVFSYLTPAFEKFGSMAERYLGKVLPITEPLGEALAVIADVLVELWDDVLQEIEKSLPNIVMTMRIFADLLIEMKPVLLDLAYALSRVASVISWVFRQITDLMKFIPRVQRLGFDKNNEGNGIQGLFPGGNKSSVGAAAGNAIYTSFYELGQKARQLAVQSGASPEVKATEKLNSNFTQFAEFIKAKMTEQKGQQTSWAVSASGDF